MNLKAARLQAMPSNAKQCDAMRSSVKSRIRRSQGSQAESGKGPGALDFDLCLVEFKRGVDSMMIPCMVKHQKVAAIGGIPEISRESEDFQLEISRIVRISSKIWLCHVHVKHEASGSGHSVK